MPTSSRLNSGIRSRQLVNHTMQVLLHSLFCRGARLQVWYLWSSLAASLEQYSFVRINANSQLLLESMPWCPGFEGSMSCKPARRCERPDTQSHILEPTALQQARVSTTELRCSRKVHHLFFPAPWSPMPFTHQTVKQSLVLAKVLFRCQLQNTQLQGDSITVCAKCEHLITKSTKVIHERRWCLDTAKSENGKSSNQSLVQASLWATGGTNWAQSCFILSSSNCVQCLPTGIVLTAHSKSPWCPDIPPVPPSPFPGAHHAGICRWRNCRIVVNCRLKEHGLQSLAQRCLEKSVKENKFGLCFTPCRIANTFALPQAESIATPYSVLGR